MKKLDGDASWEALTARQMVPQAPNVVTKFPHRRTLLHDTGFHFGNLFHQGSNESGLLGMFRQEGFTNSRRVMVDLIDEARAGFNICLEVI